jgi:hypothetical protein
MLIARYPTLGESKRPDPPRGSGGPGLGTRTGWRRECPNEFLPKNARPETSRHSCRDGLLEAVYAVGLDRLDFFPMLRRRSRVIALALTLVGLPTAQAADTMLTLACQGIAETKFGAKDQPSREPISFGLVLNLRPKLPKVFPLRPDPGDLPNGVFNRPCNSELFAENARPAQRMF